MRSRVSPIQDAEKWCRICEDQDGFQKRFISAYIGYGLYCTKPFEKGKFLLEYRGRLSEEENTTGEDDVNVYTFLFKTNNINYSIDAANTDCLAKWINDDKRANCVIKKLMIDRSPHLCIFALKDLSVDEELRYDYGTAGLPWRKLEKLRDSSVTQTFSASSALGMLGNPQDCFGSTVPGGSSESSSLTHQAGHACSSSEIQAYTTLDYPISDPEVSDEASDSDVSFKPSDDEESNDEIVPESSDELSSSRPVSPIFFPRRRNPNGGAETEGAGSQSSVQASRNSQPTTSTLQDGDVSSSAGSSMEIQVFTTSNNDGRSYDKPQYCPFCSMPQKKLPRHLKTPQHKDESDVQKWLATDDKKEKDRQLSLMRNYGNYQHNCAVLKEGKGILIVVYRPAYQVNPHDYLPCQDCYGYYAKHDLWKHRCSQRREEESGDNDNSKTKKRFGLCKASRMMLPTTPGVSQRTHEILTRMNNDSIARIAKSDPLIKRFADKLTMKHGHSTDQETYIRQRVREISRLVIEYRTITDKRSAELEDLICPANFTDVTRATRSTAGFNEETHLYTTPSLALKIGHTLKVCAEILRGEALMNGDEVSEKQCRSFISLYSLHWEESVSHHALRSLNDAKRNNPKLLPLTEDVVKLSKYLKEEVKSSEKQLLKADGPEGGKCWKRLAEALLAQIVVFNRKRPGEVSKMSLNDFSKCSNGEDCIMEGALTEWEKALCRVLWRIEIVGKRSRTVAVLLTEDMKNALTSLTNKRAEASISVDNSYLFAHSGDGHIRACDCLREYSIKCGAKHPEYLRATRLRKQIATVSQIMNLKENELDVLANFLGHDIRTHRQYYRLPDSTLQIAKVSKVLMKMEKGDLRGLAGKSLADVEVDPNEEYNTDAESDQSESEGTDDHDDLLPSKVRKGKGADAARTRKVPAIKKPWSNKEKAAVADHLGFFIRARTVPTKAPIVALLKREPEAFAARTWRNVKDFVRNQTRKVDPMGFMKH